jgi:hypothetical protein
MGAFLAMAGGACSGGSSSAGSPTADNPVRNLGANCAEVACDPRTTCEPPEQSPFDMFDFSRCVYYCDTDADCIHTIGISDIATDKCILCIGRPGQCAPSGMEQLCRGGYVGGPTDGGGGGGGGDKRFGDKCSSTIECPAGLKCMHYYGYPGNDKRCLQPCSSHDDCDALTHPDFTLPFVACWSCTDGPAVPDPGEEQCVPMYVCGYSGVNSPSCSDCLKICKGLPSCCTGCGCMCQDECGGC